MNSLITFNLKHAFDRKFITLFQSLSYNKTKLKNKMQTKDIHS